MMTSTQLVQARTLILKTYSKESETRPSLGYVIEKTVMKNDLMENDLIASFLGFIILLSTPFTVCNGSESYKCEILAFNCY